MKKNFPGKSGSRKGRLSFDVLYEDADLIVVEKPIGIITSFVGFRRKSHAPGLPSLEELVDDYLRKGQLKSRKKAWLVHRLDRDTSGVIMFAKSESVAQEFRDSWNERTEKTYFAKVEGRLDEPFGVFESYLRDDPKTMKVSSVSDRSKGKFSSTEWKEISYDADADVSFVEVALKTGRKNQIRVHFSEAGHPVVGDEKYGAKRADRLYLHSAKIVFVHPRTGRRVEVFSPRSIA
jgi:tRNA pseudouridine32 synthase/23S rRNA pseudouridine746 synthase/23S rRNA pseudouridine1911/1915/1917 synthase